MKPLSKNKKHQKVVYKNVHMVKSKPKQAILLLHVLLLNISKNSFEKEMEGGEEARM